MTPTDTPPAVAREDDDLTPRPSPCNVEGHTTTDGIPCDACMRLCIECDEYERVERERDGRS